MEAAGIALDRDALAALEREFAAEISRLEAEIYAAVGHEFTIGSPKQLGDILFVELGLPKGRKTKTGYSTDASVLEELRGVHPVDRARSSSGGSTPSSARPTSRRCRR